MVQQVWRNVSDAKRLKELETENARLTSAALSVISRVVQARIESAHGLYSGNDFVGNEYAWKKPFGSWADQDDRNSVAGYKARTSGIAGVDGVVSEYARLGASFAYG